jgi:hypothetical protein
VPILLELRTGKGWWCRGNTMEKAVLITFDTPILETRARCVGLIALDSEKLIHMVCASSQLSPEILTYSFKFITFINWLCNVRPFFEGQGSVAGFPEHNQEPSGILKVGGYYDHLGDPMDLIIAVSC